MSYNFIYKIGTNSEVYSPNYDNIELCNTAQSRWMSSEKTKNSPLSIRVQGCNDYSLEDGVIAPVYNINANADPNKASPPTNIDGDTTSDASTVRYTLLEPVNGKNTVSITSTSFADYIQSSFNVLFGVFIVWSVFRLAYGGVLFMTSDIINKKIAGKEMIINSVKYVFLALITYSIMFFVNPDILDNKITNIVKGGVVSVGRGVREAVGGVVTGVVGSGGVTKPNTNVSVVANATELLTEVLADESSARTNLSAGGISINNPPCTSVGARSCTTVGLINNKTINEIIDLEKECKKYNNKCEVIIQGGTEWWSHGGGVINPNLNESKHVPRKYSAQGIDLGLDTYLITFLKTSGKSLGSNRYCYDRYEYSGEIYCDEINSARHFHINWKI